ncbi:MAG TPA: Mov34/MPN/PAD-1 family protein [Bellilinea sp.]|nr:Mov34/MPN/PAD-1 family protein [Bellilinea sp.]
MMKLILPKQIRSQLEAALQDAGGREIGGILMGKHVAESTFRVMDLTIQSRGGNVFSFVRQLRAALSALSAFFHRTRHEYRRFNYLGEWHSHPCFATHPSTTDSATMWEIAEDSHVGANFVVLLIVRLDNQQFRANAFLYMLGHPVTEAQVFLE